MVYMRLAKLYHKEDEEDNTNENKKGKKQEKDLCDYYARLSLK